MHSEVTPENSMTVTQFISELKRLKKTARVVFCSDEEGNMQSTMPVIWFSEINGVEVYGFCPSHAHALDC